MEYTDLRSAGAAARAGVEQQPLGTHADEIETSNLLYVVPQVVRMDLARPELAPDRPGGLTRNAGSPPASSRPPAPGATPPSPPQTKAGP